jgi:hypothetical protein
MPTTALSVASGLNQDPKVCVGTSSAITTVLDNVNPPIVTDIVPEYDPFDLPLGSNTNVGPASELIV